MKYLKSILVVLLLIMPLKSKADNYLKKFDNYVITSGIGLSNIGKLPLNLNLSVYNKRNIITFNYTYFKELNLSGNLPDESAWYTGFFYGLIKENEDVLFDASLGITIISFYLRQPEKIYFGSEPYEYYTTYYGERKYVVGVPLQAEFYKSIFENIGVGCILFANFNEVQNIYGLTFNLYLKKWSE